MREPKRAYSLLVFAIGFCFLLSLEMLMRPAATNGMYFQKWSSEDMVQTISILDLRETTIESLFYLHIQPPAFDGLRAGLSLLWPKASPEILLKNVDNGLYFVWVISYALTGSLVYLWLYRTTNTYLALAGSLAFFLHPAAIFYASFLDGTFLAALFVLWSYYEFWKLAHDKGSIGPFTISIIGLFLLRAVFQWQTVFIYAVSMLLIKIPLRKIILFVAIFGSVAGVFTLKQYYLFGLTSTSSFSGLNCFHGLGSWPDPKIYAQSYGAPEGAVFSFSPPLPDVLTRSIKLTGVPSYNELGFLPGAQAITKACPAEWSKQPISRIVITIAHNIAIYFQPSSRYISPGLGQTEAETLITNVIVERLPWRGVYDFIFSGASLALILVISFAGWLLSHTRLDIPFALGMLLPALYIFAVCVLFEKGENMRYKFFLEPVFYVFAMTQIYAFASIVRKKFA